MGSLLTWIIGIPIIGFGAYCLIKGVKNEVKGGCSSCSGCSEYSCPSRKE
ncbi:FeoB-associated Cys-rich membrane protein [Crassaminicella indica]|uniref:FeoB-associated Cys-rich membrane protein n=1 Tax=Crassaminicella indica TaxID=2855394 RepID=A0ABX8RCP5_9CLOT|nr:FeoB-associated Cys-rich membrane protein [Crassaminicella indica]QXM06837.1 FeoB-associated Cys-rich membrane protein [Crassaminicella indica]